MTPEQKQTLDLCNRSPKDADGWSKCSSAIYEQIIAPMPVELVERKEVDGVFYARLTDAANNVLAWS